MKKALSLLLVVVMTLGLITVPSMAANTQRSDYEMKLVGTDVKSGGKDSIRLELQAKGAQIAGTQLAAIRYKKDQLVAVRPNGTAVTVTESNTMIGGVANLTTAATDSYEFSTPQAYLKDTGDGYVTVTIMVAVSSGTSTFCSTGLTGLAFITLQLVPGVTYDDLNSKSIMWCTASQAADVSLNAAAAVNDGSVNICYNIDNTETVEFATAPALIYTGSDRTVSTPITAIALSLDKSEVTVDGTNGGTITVTATKTPSDATKDVTLSVSGPAGAKGVTLSGTTITVAKDATAGTYTVTAKGDAVTETATFEVKRAASVVTTVTLSPTSGTATLKAAGGADAITVGVTVKDQYGAEMAGQTATISGQPTGVTYTGGKLTFDNTARATTGAQNVTFTVGTKTATFALTIKKGAQTAPTTPTGVKTTTVGGHDGKITGVTAAMEYSSNGTDWTKCTGTEVTGLAKGTYKVRYAATDYLDASPAKDVTIGEPGKTDTPTVTIASTPAADNGTVTIAEDGSATLTATVTPATGTITYQWKKDNVNVATNGTNSTLTVAAADAGEYTCVVTREAPGESVSDPATSNKITVEVKTKTAVTVTKKADQTNFKTGAVSSIALTDIATVDPAAAASKLTATIVAYEKAVTPGTPAKDAVPCNCSKSSEDPTTATHDEGCTYQPAVPATPDTVAYNPVTTLANGKTYFLGYSIAALTDDTYSYAGVSAPSAPAVEADEANFVKVTTRAASSGGGGGSSTTRYTVTYDAGEHGKLDGSATERVESGKTPTKVPSVVADKGYKFVGWTLNGKSVKPASTKITAATKFVAEYEAADKVTYIQGMDKNHFQPAGNATRGQLATMLARLSKDYDASKTYTGKAPDVENGKWYTNTVNFAINQGIMNGFEDGMFRPTENIRRGEFAAMLARYLGLNTSSKAHFADVTDHWAAGYINALADAGIVDGFEDGTFKAQNLLTRAEAVKMINLAVEMKYDEKADYDNSFVDVAEGAWYYEYVMPAANLDVTDYQR